MKNLFRPIIVVLFNVVLFTYAHVLQAQTGETNVLKSTTKTYAPQNVSPNGSWALSGGGTLSNTSNSSTDVTWTSTGDFDLVYQIVQQNPPAPLGDGQLTTFVIHTFHVTVFEIETPTISVVNNCGSTQLSHNGLQDDVTFYWKVPGSSTFSNSSITLNVTTPGTYRVKGIHADGEGTAASQAITIDPALNTTDPLLSSNLSYCDGASPEGSIISVASTESIDTYYLYGSDGNEITNVQGNGGTINFGRRLAGNYSVKVGRSGCGQALLGSVTITEEPDAVNHQITTGSTDLSYCTNAVTFTAMDADPTSSFQWKVDGVAAGSSTSDTFTPSAIHAGPSRVVTVKYKIKAPCSNTLVEKTAIYSPVELIAPTTAVLNFTPSSGGTVCKGDNVDFSFTVSGSSSYTYEWSTGVDNLTEINRDINANATKTSISIDVNDACATVPTLFKEVTHNIFPDPDTTGPSVENASYCSTESSASIKIDNPNASDIYYLYLGNSYITEVAGNVTTGGKVVFPAQSSGTYTIKVANASCDHLKQNLTTNAKITQTIASTWYLDEDGDGFHSDDDLACSAPGPDWKSTTSGIDCDDDDDNIEGAPTWYYDDDNDGYGDPNTTKTQCSQPTNYVANDDDCDDGDEDINPDLVWYYDSDSDGYGDPNTTTTNCTQPNDYVSNNTDCDDNDNTKHTVMDCNTAPIAPINTGKYLETGASHTFTWLDESGGVMEYNVFIGGTKMNNSGYITGGSYSWTPSATDSGIKFRVENRDQDRAFVTAAFDVIAPIEVTLDQSKYYPGDDIAVNWTGGRSGLNYKVELFQGTTELTSYQKTVTGTNTTITIGDDTPYDTDFTVKVSQNTTNNLNGTGTGISSDFTIYKRLKVTYPTVANESFVFGETVNITWEGEDEDGLYDIKILDGATELKSWDSVPGPSLTLDWTVVKAETDVGSNYKVQVKQGSYQDKSNNVFAINFPAAEAIDPSNGSILAVGQSVPLTWSGNVASDYYFFLNGSLQSTITGTSTPWTVPGLIGENQQLRLEATDGLSVSESGTFEIAPQLVIASVGPVVMQGETLYLSWTGGTANLNYQVDLINGANTTSIYTGTAKATEYLVPGDIALGPGYQIRVRQNENLEVSSALFEVITCTLTTTASSDQNYVRTFTARTKLGPCMAGADDPFLVQESINYMDGLGRPIQAVIKNGTPANGSGNTFDLITHFDYDVYGRQDKSYLPHPDSSNTGALSITAATDQQNYYIYRFDSLDGLQAYSQQIYEPSPLNRVLKSAAPGDTWKASGTHTVDTDYQLNDGTGKVRFMIAEGDSIVDYGFYEVGELSIIKSSDENNGTNEGISFLYKNRRGQDVLKRTRLQDTTYAKTYYIYDDYGKLCHVIQPEGVRIIEEDANAIDWNSLEDENFRKNWMFSYQYDSRQRMIAKRVPGADWQRMVYDSRDRVVMTQDGNLNLDEFVTEDVILDGTQNPLDTSYVVFGAKIKLTPGFQFSANNAGDQFKAKANPGIESGGWIFTKYDELNRPVMTGRINRIADRSTLVAEAKTHYSNGVSYGESYGGGPLFGYSNQTFPTEADSAVVLTEDNLLTVTYYDTYDFTGAPVPAGARSQVKGQVTGTKTRVLETDTWLTNITYYDERYRVMMTVSDNYLSGKDTVIMSYRNQISPLVAMTETRHTGGEDVNIIEQFTYDHMDRLLTTTHSINGESPVVIASNTYNKIGELVEKNLGGDNEPVQSVDYDYNIRGWLTSINEGSNYDDADDQFGMTLSYDNAPVGHQQYNGNIGQMLWRSQGGGLPTTAQNYVYEYDASSRLTAADYTGTGNFDVSGIAYDHNGNIQTLQRNTRDILTYEYGSEIGQSNHLLSVADAGTSELFEDGNNSGNDYDYDDNGNLIEDLNKGIASIQYNHLNLPQLVTFQNGNTVAYTYDAVGMKLRKVTKEGANMTTTDYLGGMHFVDNSLSFLQHTEGRAVKDGSIFNYEFNLTDHLGNVRVSVNESEQVVQRDGYYPFGMSFNSSADSPENLYKYNGKEEQPETDWLDYGARMYDPILGRFFTQDRFAEKYYDLAPYQYTANNPINYIDINGDSIKIVNGEETFVYTEGAEYDGENKFISQAVKDLNKISRTKKGAKRIGDLVGSESVYNVREAGSLKESKYKANEEAGGGDIYYSQEGGVLDGVSYYQNSHFTVGHEIQHAWDHDQGKEEYLTTTQNGVVTSEINAVAFENYLRATAGETKMRTTYTGTTLFRNSSPEFFLNRADPLRKNEGLWRPDFYVSPSTDATYYAPNIWAFRVNKQTGEIVNPNQ